MSLVEFVNFVVSILGCSFIAYVFASIRNRQRDQLLHLSTKDELTGVGNRRALNEKLDELIRINKRNKSNISLLLLDLDNFKQVNDREGHDAGDQILISVADAIQTRIRASDSLFRYGGDEFVVVVSDADSSVAIGIAEDFRALVEANEAMTGSMVSISLGVAQFAVDETAQEWFRRADEALFDAKRAGRNQVLMSRPIVAANA